MGDFCSAQSPWGRARLIRPLGALVALLALSAACSAGAAPSSTPQLTPEQARDHAAAAMRALSSAHFTVLHEEGGTDLGFGLLTKAKGDGLFPDKASFVATAIAEQFGGVTLEFDIIQHGDDTYLRDRISNRWQALPPDTLLISFAGVNDAIADAIAAIDNPALPDSNSSEADEPLLLEGAIEATALAGLVPSAPAGNFLDLQVWLGREDFLVRRVTMTGILLEGDPPSMTRFLELSEYNKPVTVEPPI